MNEKWTQINDNLRKISHLIDCMTIFPPEKDTFFTWKI